MAVLALGAREASNIKITGNFYENRSSFKFVFHEKRLPFKKVHLKNCTGPNKVRTELKILQTNIESYRPKLSCKEWKFFSINNHIDMIIQDFRVAVSSK